MKSFPVRGALAAATLALTGLGGVAYAQPAPAPQGHGPMQMQRPDPAQMAARRAAHLRTILQLRPDQEPALTAYIAAMQPPAGAREKMRERMGQRRAQGPTPMTTPERLDRQRARMAEHQARFDQHAAATKRFYAALSPSQQKAFDAMPKGGPRHGPGKRGGRGGRHG